MLLGNLLMLRSLNSHHWYQTYLLNWPFTTLQSALDSWQFTPKLGHPFSRSTCGHGLFQDHTTHLFSLRSSRARWETHVSFACQTLEMQTLQVQVRLHFLYSLLPHSSSWTTHSKNNPHYNSFSSTSSRILFYTAGSKEWTAEGKIVFSFLSPLLFSLISFLVLTSYANDKDSSSMLCSNIPKWTTQRNSNYFLKRSTF